ncbi:MAG: hypothetical protein JNK84_10860 [Phreatobacter sp.]|uniref:hypothetical protein n=1 Tax=Phreatobacter sp. TaxID=1966341 RepID=UPI001A56BFFF|nr:hypothetical protein [Phreatobacter sp.]MBL8569573.1 hypothetical protein [Phreatobacter sp.]
MLQVVDDAYEPYKPQPSLVEASRRIRLAAEQLSSAYDMLAETELEDRTNLQFTIYVAVAKLAPVIATLATEIAATTRRKPPVA